MKLDGYSNLTEMMRKAPMTAQTVEEFRDKAMQALDHAVDVFFKPEREVAEGKAAYDQLTDVERALRAYQGRFRQDQGKVNEKAQSMLETGVKPRQREEVGQTESALKNGKPLANGMREFGYSSANVRRLDELGHETTSIARLADKMGKVLPIYGSVAMLPGPLAVSLKDHLKETLQWNNSSSSSSRTRVEQESFRLLTLSASKRLVTSQSSSESSSSGKAETTTVDERVMPGLHEIRAGLSELGFEDAQSTTFSVSQDVREYDRFPRTEGWPWNRREVVEVGLVNQGSIEVAKGEIPYYPARMKPDAISDNRGLSRPGEGSDLVDLVAGANLDQDFVDSFRDKALGVLDRAVETLYNKGREVAEGRKRYDELSNLQRALELAEKKFGLRDYDREMNQQIQLLEQVAPLYACVAMVPGEMSSTVKNHAKEVFEAQQSARSSSSIQGSELKGSLLTLGMSETTVEGSSHSESQGSMKYETTTTDERIMPKLHRLRVKLDQMQISEGKTPGLFIPPDERTTQNGRW